uniref:Glucosylceramidase n=1 Tax=Timema cristinae TaxID=61476 RepID=A0A7R9CKI6_TIMCR|nr:unnamed protein product [Timema cristinae]
MSMPLSTPVTRKPFTTADDCVRLWGDVSYACVCNATYCDDITPAELESLPSGQFRHYTSDIRHYRLWRTTEDFKAEANNETSTVYFTLDLSKLYQEILGFGGAMTDSAALNIANLSAPAQELLLRSFFSSEGQEFSFIRTPMAASDFSVRHYVYDDVVGDVTLQNFSLVAEDLQFKIPYLKRAQELSPGKIKIFTAPWNVPDWIKVKSGNDIRTNQRGVLPGVGGLLCQFVNPCPGFFEAYSEEGVDFWGLTPENEPQFLNRGGWTPETMAPWVVNYLKPALDKAGFGHLKLMICDDQRTNVPNWSENVSEDKTEGRRNFGGTRRATITMWINEQMRNISSGLAVHFYMDSVNNTDILDRVHQDFPEKFILYTEACNGTGKPVVIGSWDRGEGYSSDIIQVLTHWGSGWVDWNLALNPDGGPNIEGIFVDAQVIVNSTSDEFYKQPIFYHMAHFAKFVPSGSRRADLTTEDGKGVEGVAFLTQDGVAVIVLLNRSDSNLTVVITDKEQRNVEVLVEKRTIHTILYNN